MASINETETFQHYQVLRRADGTLHELGRGAMGVTYKAFDTNLRSYVALKVINALHLDSETARARFLREARAAAALRHRNIASVYHLGNDDQSFFYAMEFVDGQTLEDMVKQAGKAVPATDALQIALQVSRALGAAGKQGLVHRDIKPANIMVEREDDDEDSFVVKVIDFGLARSAAGGEGSAHITMGGFVGTPQYASPEQLEEKDLDIRSDMYSLGVTIWYMLAGRPPFVGPLSAVFIQQMTKEPPWEQMAGQPEPVKALLARLLQKDPDKRPQSPAELRRDIEACLRSIPTSPNRLNLAPKSGAPTRADDTSTGSRTSATKTRETPLAFAAPTTPTAAEHAADPVPAAPAPMETLRPAVITTGSLLSGRFDLGDFIGQGNNGRVFRARDLAREQRAVAIKVLHADVLSSENERIRLEETLVKLRRAWHPHLMEVETFEQTPGCRFLVEEWVNGFTLVDLLRSRGHLPVRETLQLLAQTASAADHAFGNDLNRLELGLHQILVHFPSVAAGSQAGRALLGTSVDQWPTNFSLKLDALGITREVGDSVTWGGDMTLMPSAPVLGRDTQTSIRGMVESSQFFALGMLTYELLNGAPPAHGRGEEGRGIKYAVLPSLNEEANDVLRRMLTPNPGYTSGVEFFQALCKASGVQIPLPSSTTIMPSASIPAAIPESAVPEHAGSETLLAEPPTATHAFPDTHAGETLVSDEENTGAWAVDRPLVEEPTADYGNTVVTARAPAVVEPPPAPEETEAQRAAERLEAEHAEAERLEAERLKAEHAEAQRIETERLEAEHAEAQRVEAERLEAEHAEAQRIEDERLEAERLEVERMAAERREAQRIEAERVAAERREAQRLEAERIEAARLRAEQVEAERIEAARLKAERLEAERVEAARVKAERIEAERIETARIKAERLEAQRVEGERIEAERVEAARVKAERLKAQRLEAERLKAEQVEAERIKAERLKAQRLEAERLKAERLAAQKLEAEQLKAQKLEAERAKTQQLADQRRHKLPADRAEISLDSPAIAPADATDNLESEATPSRRRMPLVVGSSVAVAVLVGVCSLMFRHGSQPAMPTTETVAIARSPSAAPSTTPIPTGVTATANPSPAATPGIVNSATEAVVQPPVVMSTPGPAAVEATPAVAVVASTPPPPVRAAVSTPPPPPPDTRAPHTRDVAAAREREDREAEKEREDQRRQAAAKRDDDRRETEKKEPRDVVHKEPKPEATPKPKPVIARATPAPKPKPATATPDPNANRSAGPSIGFMR